MFAPEIDDCISRFEGGLHATGMDGDTLAEAKKLFHTAWQIAPAESENSRREFWVSAGKGTAEDMLGYFGKYYSGRKLEKALRSLIGEYTRDTYWYRITLVYQDARKNGKEFYGIFINSSYILSYGDINARDYPVNASELVKWLAGEAERVVDELREGTYNSRLRKGLPVSFRYGTIPRKDLWDIFPEKRQSFLSGISENEIGQFITSYHGYCRNGQPAGVLLTARDFFEACAYGYRALGKQPRSHCLFTDTEEEHTRYGGVTPKEMYYMFADGRDEGLSEVPLDDAGEFRMWRKREGKYHDRFGGHPYEVLPAYSLRNSLHMYIEGEGDGEHFVMTGSTEYRSPDTVIFYNAVKAAGYPVVLEGMRRIASRILETDIIGIVPEDRSTDYWDDTFPEGTDLIHFPAECSRKQEKMLMEKIHWLGLAELKLAERKKT